MSAGHRPFGRYQVVLGDVLTDGDDKSRRSGGEVVTLSTIAACSVTLQGLVNETSSGSEFGE